jgi:hypothetical protein
MPNENLDKLVQAARDKKPTTFKQHLHAEIGSRVEAGISEIRADLAKNMFNSGKVVAENCEGHPDGVEHTHEDGTVHTHEGGDKEHTHDEEVEEGWKKGKYTIKDENGKILGTYSSGGKAKKIMDDLMQKGDYSELTVSMEEGTLPPALQKAIDAKKKNNSDDDDEDKTPAKEEVKKEKFDIRDAAKRVLNREDSDKSEPGTQGDDAEYAKKRDAVLKKFGVKSCAACATEEEKKACFKALDDAHVADHEE